MNMMISISIVYWLIFYLTSIFYNLIILYIYNNKVQELSNKDLQSEYYITIIPIINIISGTYMLLDIINKKH